MSTIVIKNLPDALHAGLKERARRNHRSVTKEAINLIEAGVAAQPSAKTAPEPIRLKGARGLAADELEAALTDTRYARYASLDELNRYMDELRADRDDAEP